MRGTAAGLPKSALQRTRSHRKALLDLAALFALPIREIEGCVVISPEKEVARHLSSFPNDPVGFEAFVNHVHLEDVVRSDAGPVDRQALMKIGRDLIRVWSDRLQLVLRGRPMLFYLGGSRGVSLRFHLAREGTPDWLDLGDQEFVRREKVEIYRVDEGGLTGFLMHKGKIRKVLLRDRSLVRQGFGRFAGTARSEDGDAILFGYPSGVRYRVPLTYVLQWFDGSAEGEGQQSEGDEAVSVLRTRTLWGGHWARLYLSDGRRYDVAWDTVLMACEPLYEHFGGLTEQSRELARRWQNPMEPFRSG